MNAKSIETAVSLCGSQAALAAAVGVSQQVVWQWLNGRRPVPAVHCIPIENATAGAVTRYALRPDVFGLQPPLRPPIPERSRKHT
ncbi:helix-turn-helix domain-containing protein [Dokdonella soli]|uniref:helix-turn-helix domain-containing protein n=1 Tax=Dokdonella soli TaxID=529810 RepID=UPI0031E35816